ncbi:DUF397 domain-containing protein [Micromonospora endophytica]|uniref:DUF397 domain-containing protein n=1 Tax=Micromonospora endophytica TaxID=515350 RepID=A0A2W2BXJ9_9ACTN|nr:DUF397 domain-containing protein [Micromonospora endophytica]PZF92025.1 DUF397 domain-containing protein [Micromonospora endophytica]RIW46432.1 DUF397 domain-containing protein [Micromonospora endophytica]BCJ57393.1 DUF397 domain-containing protein [Micromonospora endophytica]
MTALDLSRAKWRTSSRSVGNGNCVEVTTVAGGVAVRDSKDRHGPVLAFSPSAWSTFVARLPAGEGVATAG